METVDSENEETILGVNQMIEDESLEDQRIRDQVSKRRAENEAIIQSLAKGLETINVKNGTSHQRCLAASSIQQAMVYLDMDSQMLGGLDLFNSSSVYFSTMKPQ